VIFVERGQIGAGVRASLPTIEKDLTTMQEIVDEIKRNSSSENYITVTSLKTGEGFFYVNCGVEQGIDRGLSYAPYADLIWMETSNPDLDYARQFAEGIHAKFPGKMLAYNCSPSFNWAAKLSVAEMETFREDLAAMGYKFQFITLAGFHSNGLVVTKLARSFGDRGMLAYVQDIQRQEKKEEVELLKHQKWSGAELVDRMVNVASGGQSSTAAMGAGVTEDQFSKH